MSEAVTHEDHHDHHPSGMMRWVTTTNHKDIGTMYLVFSLVMFFIGGAMAMIIRLELFPGAGFTTIVSISAHSWHALKTTSLSMMKFMQDVSNNSNVFTFNMSVF